MNSKTFKTILAILVILLVLAGGAYWYLFMRGTGSTSTPVGNGLTNVNGFEPLNENPTPADQGEANTATSSQSAPQEQASIPVPALRELSTTPIGGYGSVVNASTTVVRWIDRGAGNIYETSGASSTITTLSNTVVPRIYQSAWNAELSAFVATLLPTDDSTPDYVYASLIPQATSTGDVTPFALRGSDLPDSLIAYAASPEHDKIFMLTDEDGSGVGYISSFDGSSMTKIFTTPLTQVNVDWPIDNEIAITTKGSAQYEGYLYLVNTKTGVWKKAFGPLFGLSAVVSHDGKYALISATGNNNDLLTYIYTIATGAIADAGIRTLADKCAWGNFYQDVVYCAVPSTPVAGTYPDDWYTGVLSTVDNIWQVDAGTGQVRLISSLLQQSNHIIDGFNLGLDSKDNYLFFMNKNDLSFWSLDLVQTQ